ncbi:MAG: AAA family ATPase [bacterium]|nr:AAA family ATPase [bacterium]
MGKKFVNLDYKSPSAKMRIWERRFREYVVGQDRAIKRVITDLCLTEAGFSEKRKPKCIFVFAGPTGVGKTHLVEILAKLLFGELDAYTYIDCNQFGEAHDVSKIIGSPPGYVGFNENVALLTQEKIDSFGFYKTLSPKAREELENIRFLKKKFGRPKTMRQAERLEHLQAREEEILISHRNPDGYPSIILFDEIEKAHRTFFTHLMDIIDKARLSMGDGSITDFHNSYIFMTSNVGAEKIKNILSGKGAPGFIHESYKDVGEVIYRTTLGEMEGFFRGIPEFLGRIGKENIIVFRELQRTDMAAILEARLKEVEEKLSRVEGLKLYFSRQLKSFILDEADDPFNKILGARPLQRLVKKHVLEPLSVLVMKGPSEGGIGPGDYVSLTVKNKEVEIRRLLRPPKKADAAPALLEWNPRPKAEPEMKIPVESSGEGETDIPAPKGSVTL